MYLMQILDPLSPQGEDVSSGQIGCLSLGALDGWSVSGGKPGEHGPHVAPESIASWMSSRGRQIVTESNGPFEGSATRSKHTSSPISPSDVLQEIEGLQTGSAIEGAEEGGKVVCAGGQLLGRVEGLSVSLTEGLLDTSCVGTVLGF